ncbi:hypothetical protein MTO96_039572, partial [Rhipicephalus appendiculatus]
DSGRSRDPPRQRFDNDVLSVPSEVGSQLHWAAL